MAIHKVYVKPSGGPGSARMHGLLSARDGNLLLFGGQ